MSLVVVGPLKAFWKISLLVLAGPVFCEAHTHIKFHDDPEASRGLTELWYHLHTSFLSPGLCTRFTPPATLKAFSVFLTVQVCV